jgi:hypothetical protein
VQRRTIVSAALVPHEGFHYLVRSAMQSMELHATIDPT